MNQVYSADVHDTSRKSEQELFQDLGGDLAGTQALPILPAELAERGKRWFISQQVYLEKQICRNDALKKFAQTNSDNSAIAVEVAQILIGLILPVNPVTLAVLLVKKGLKEFCTEQWRKI